jgi:hypothetical protein
MSRAKLAETLRRGQSAPGEVGCCCAWRRPAEAGGRQRRQTGMPEVGVEASTQVLESTALRLTTENKYPQSYPHGRGGTLLTPPPEQRVLNLGDA